jgi:hypothetical protein
MLTPRRGRRALAAIAMVVSLALLLSLANSTKRAAAGSSSSLPPACALLMPSDLQGVLGGTVGAGAVTSAPNGGETICDWTVTSTNGSGYGAQLDVKRPFSAKEFAQQRQIASGSTNTLKHLGDSAFSERAKVGPQVFDDLWVHKGTTAFRLEVLKDLGSKPLTRLATIVLTNLSVPAH